jgi:hypothetical protein
MRESSRALVRLTYVEVVTAYVLPSTIRGAERGAVAGALALGLTAAFGLEYLRTAWPPRRRGRERS